MTTLICTLICHYNSPLFSLLSCFFRYLAWRLQNKFNGWDVSKMTSSEIVEHFKLVDYFTLNLDKTCMAGSEGELHIIGSKEKKKHEKNVADSRESITSVRVGSAGNVDGPRFYLAKGKEIEMSAFKDFTKHFPAPEGSRVIMTPNAYMTDDAWVELVPFLCRGIRAMERIKDHPDLWVVLSLDGFGSHLVPESLVVFNEHKILVVKEEADTSQVSQAYDQVVARADKRKFRELLDTFKAHHKGVLNQWSIVLIVNAAYNEVAKTNAWVTSFIRVNFCPSKRKPFAEWLARHKCTVEAADHFFKARNGLYDAMPAFWKNMTEDERRAVAAKMKTFPDTLTVSNVKELLMMPGIKFDDVEKLRGCIIIANEDPTVFVTPVYCAEDEENDELTDKGQRLLDCDYAGFAFAPKDLMAKYKKNRGDRDVAKTLFCHMTNFVARNHGYHSRQDLVPSPYLDIEMPATQIELFNPTIRDVQIGAIIEQCTGKAAQKKMAKRRMDAVTGNINSYARVLNGPDQMNKIQEYNELAATMSVLQREREQKQKEQREKKKLDDEAKALRKSEKEKEAIARAAELGPWCKSEVEKGIVHVLTLRLPQRKDILRYYFQMASVEIEGTSKSVYKLTLAESTIALKRLMPPMPSSS